MLGLGDGLKETLAQEMDFANNEQVRGLLEALATLERNRNAALEAHLEALDVDDVELVDVPDHETRLDELTALIEARVSGDPWDYWVKFQAPDALEGPDRARDYAGMDADEWEQRIAKFADVYRKRFDETDDLTDRDLAGHHIESRYGLSLDEFEETVVNWRPARVMERAVTGPMQDMTQAVIDATEAVENTGETDE